MAFKMKGPTFFNVGKKYPKQNPSAVFQQTYDESDTDTRVYDISQEKYDAWAKDKDGAPDIRYLGSKENNKWIEQYLTSKKSGSSETKETKKPGKDYDYDSDPDRIYND